MLFKEPINLNLKDADIIYYPGFFTEELSTRYFSTLKKNIEWQQDTITLFGKTHLQPRLTALYANNNLPYSYSNIIMYPKTFTQELLKIKETIENKLQLNFSEEQTSPKF